MSLENVSATQLRKAATIMERIEALQSDLKAIIGGAGSSEAPRMGRPPGKRFSASARRKMAASQKARWARIKGGDSVKAEASTKPKRKMSAAGRAKIAAAAKARWAKAKAAGKNAL